MIDLNSPALRHQQHEKDCRSAALNGVIIALSGHNKRLKRWFYTLSGLLFFSLSVNGLLLLEHFLALGK